MPSATPGGPVRVAIVGTGFAASSHVDALRRVPGVEVAALIGSSAERARAAAIRFGLEPGIATTLEAALGEGAVDAVHNCTPNDAHAVVTLAALAGGAHVLSEKPLGLDLSEANRLTEAAAASGVVTGVCFNYRHFPLVQQARAMVRSGDAGVVHLVHGAYLQDWLLRADDWNWRLRSDRAGATRAVGDIGSHWIDLVEHVVGTRVVDVMAELGRLHDTRLAPRGDVETFGAAPAQRTPVAIDTEDWGSILLRFDDGAKGSVTVSQVSPGRKNRLWFEIDTANASFVWDQEEPNRLWIGRRETANADLVRDPGLLAPGVSQLAHYPGGHQEGWPDALRNLFLDFYAAVRAHRERLPNEATFASFDDARHVMAVVDAVAASDRGRRWVSVSDDLVPARTEVGG